MEKRYAQKRARCYKGEKSKKVLSGRDTKPQLHKFEQVDGFQYGKGVVISGSNIKY